MARKIKRVEWTDSYLKHKAAAEKLGDNGYCSVIAIANVCGVSYEEAYKATQRAGRKHGRGTHYFMTVKAVQELGFTLTKVEPSYFIAQYPKAHRVLQSVTSHHPRRFNKVWRNGKSYLMSNHSHMWSVVNGETHDWAVNNALRASDIWLVEKI